MTLVQGVKKSKLTKRQKEDNRAIFSKRVLIGYMIGGMKILRMIKGEIRVYREATRNLVMKIARAVHNP